MAFFAASNVNRQARVLTIYSTPTNQQLKILFLRLSPAEPHFPILFPILVQSDRFISFRK